MSFSVNCPECGTSLEVEDDHREWTVRCPSCRHEFRPSEATIALAPTEHDEEPRPPRKKRRSRRREADVEQGERDVATPALVLEVIGWISLVLSLVLSAFLVFAGMMQQGQPQQNPNQDQPETLIFIGSCFGVFSVPYFAAIGFGARKMRNLSSHGWGMAASIMSIAAIVLFGLCGLPIIAPGIWALVVLQRDDVKAAFRTRRRGAYWDDEEDD